jgi:hypothetical protein
MSGLFLFSYLQQPKKLPQALNKPFNDSVFDLSLALTFIWIPFSVSLTLQSSCPQIDFMLEQQSSFIVLTSFLLF